MSHPDKFSSKTLTTAQSMAVNRIFLQAGTRLEGLELKLEHSF